MKRGKSFAGCGLTGSLRLKPSSFSLIDGASSIKTNCAMRLKFIVLKPPQKKQAVPCLTGSWSCINSERKSKTLRLQRSALNKSMVHQKTNYKNGRVGQINSLRLLLLMSVPQYKRDCRSLF